MNKYEFLNELRRNLTSELPGHEVESNISYYDDYIESQKVDTHTEEETIREIGEPRLIARTIIETYKLSHIGTNHNHKSNEVYEEYSEGGQDAYEGYGQTNKLVIPLKYKVIGILSIIVILFLLFLVARALFFVFIRIVLPVLIIGGIIGFVYRLFK